MAGMVFSGIKPRAPRCPSLSNLGNGNWLFATGWLQLAVIAKKIIDK
jgi:hypothetical protein